MTPLIDPFQRAITYLRVSVTDRCDFRCVYCMSENMTFLPKKELLTLEELDRMCSTFIRMGVEKLRITGGEPLVRRDIMTFFRAMTRHLDECTLKALPLTTNGSQLERFAGDLYEAGVRRVNISLDTLDDQKFADITRWGRLAQVLRGVDAAQKAGLRVKINAVALKGFNEDELPTITKWCADRDMDLTWIEVMPMGDLGNEDRLGQYWSLKDVRAALETRWSLTDIPLRTGGPARYTCGAGTATTPHPWRGSTAGSAPSTPTGNAPAGTTHRSPTERSVDSASTSTGDPPSMRRRSNSTRWAPPCGSPNCPRPSSCPPQIRAACPMAGS